MHQGALPPNGLGRCIGSPGSDNEIGTSLIETIVISAFTRLPSRPLLAKVTRAISPLTISRFPPVNARL